MPELNGLELVHAFRRANLKTKTVLYTIHYDDVLLSDLLKAGVRGFVLKSDPESSLLAALDAIRTGRSYFSGKVSETLLEKLQGQTDRDPLTHRERQVVQLISEGWANKEIAIQLGLTMKTVGSHRANAMGKLNIQNTAGLVRWAIKNNLILA